MLIRELARSERGHDRDLDRAEKNRRCIKGGAVLSLYVLVAIFVSATLWVREHYDVPAAPPLTLDDVPVAEEQACLPPDSALFSAPTGVTGGVEPCPDDSARQG
ncbi:hypothetical protein [Candidatus Nitrospira bockiana]